MFQGCTLDLQSPMAGVSVCLLFKAISIVYTSFHFCSPVRPVALWRPGHPFCPRLGRHRLRAPPSWPRSSTAGRSVSHPVPDGNVSLWSTPPGGRQKPGRLHRDRPRGLEVLPCLGLGVQQGGNSPAQMESADSPHSCLRPACS